MENIFYGALALHITGKPVSKENIRVVLNAAGTPVDEPALEAMAAFVEALETARRRERESFDPRIINFLTSELAQHKVQTERVETLLAGLAGPAPSVAEADELTPSALNEAISLAEIIGEGNKSVPGIPKVVPATGDSGRYIYGIADGCWTMELGHIGIEGNQVRTVPYQDICAVVHNCPSEPYESSDGGMVKTWVKAHQRVLDEAKARFGTVIPLGFDTIIRPQNNATHPDQVVRDWLKEDYDRLRRVIEKIKGRDEYGVQIFYDPKVISRQVSERSEEVRQVEEEMATKSPGMAYMYKQKLERAVKSEMDTLADEWFTDFYWRIGRHSDDVVVEKTRKVSRERVMLLNLSCLVAKEKVESLGEELEEISNVEGFAVHFSGPWPPYSFVAKPAVVSVGGE
ncbi:MAG: GvpL/GvpF family gas vesicle protein [Chloroflexi bacterium]|nr:GvpL/GvpF family gas vesicle protein [Chloroflexota bacterium]